GFSDSSHFSRTFSDMLGFQPSALTRSHCELKILVNPPNGGESAAISTPPELAASSFKCDAHDRDEGSAHLPRATLAGMADARVLTSQKQQCGNNHECKNSENARPARRPH